MDKIRTEYDTFMEKNTGYMRVSKLLFCKLWNNHPTSTLFFIDLTWTRLVIFRGEVLNYCHYPIGVPRILDFEAAVVNALDN